MGVTERGAAYGPVLRDSKWLMDVDEGLDRRQLEGGNRVDQFARLLVQAGSGCGHFFHQCGVLLCGLVHLRYRFVDLVHPWLCSVLAAVISPMMSVTRRMEATTSLMV